MTHTHACSDRDILRIVSYTTRTHKTTAVYTYTDGNITSNSAKTSQNYIWNSWVPTTTCPHPRQAQKETIPTGSGRHGENNNGNCSNGVNLPPNHPAVLGPRRFEEETAPSVVLLLPSPSPSPPIPASAFLRMYLFRRTPIARFAAPLGAPLKAPLGKFPWHGRPISAPLSHHLSWPHNTVGSSTFLSPMGNGSHVTATYFGAPLIIIRFVAP